MSAAGHHSNLTGKPNVRRSARMSRPDVSASAVEVSAASPPTGKLAVLTAYALAAATIPIPFLPDRVLLRIRGAVVHDISARHGVSLTSDARSVLASPDSEQRTRLSRVAEVVARQILRRAGPLGIMSSMSRGIEVYALGFLLERYFRDVRRMGAIRVQIDEARRVRDAIDKSIVRALSPALRPAITTLAEGSEDLRDEFTRWLDALLLTTASIPSYLERRLESAFDQLVAETPELGNV
jgi:hypothetical protein